MDKPSAPNATPIYLSKDGNVSGPFTPEQIEEMKKSGEYLKFTWVWEAQNWVPISPPSLPPAPPPGTTSGTGTSTGITRPAASENTGSIKKEKTNTGITRPAIFDEKTNSNLTRAQLGGAQATPPPTRTGNTGFIQNPNHTPAAKAKAPGKETKVLTGVPAICHNNRAILAGLLGEITKEGCIFRSHETPRSLPEFHKGGKVHLNVLEESSGKSENLDATIQRSAVNDGHWEFYLGWEKLPAILEHLK